MPSRSSANRAVARFFTFTHWRHSADTGRALALRHDPFEAALAHGVEERPNRPSGAAPGPMRHATTPQGVAVALLTILCAVDRPAGAATRSRYRFC